MSSGDRFAAPREHAQLLRTYDRLRRQVQGILSDLAAPGNQKVLKEIRRRTGTAPDENIATVVAALEEALRAIQLAESDTHQVLQGPGGSEVQIDGIDNLPGRLQQFLSERGSLPGFSYEVVQDEVRGWMILWKEHTADGRIRGYGQFYERPYAWLDE